MGCPAHTRASHKIRISLNMVKKLFVLCFLLALVASEPYNLKDWTCSSWTIIGTINQPIQEVTCTREFDESHVNTHTPRFNPQLPAGLTYTLTTVGLIKTIVISGTPVVAQQLKTYSIGYKEFSSQMRIGIIGTVTSLSYGFDYMYQYTTVPTEPIPAQSDAYLNSFTITPALPTGVTMDTETGMISGTFPDTTSTNVEYTVTGSNGMSTASTVLKFIVKDISEMVTSGYTGCYWSGTTECRTPAFDYYYQNTAQFCQHETTFDYNDSYGEGSGNTWPGLDERFRDYYTSYFYGYIQILVDGEYAFYLNSDDASFLYVDTFDTPLINRDGCRGTSSSPDVATKYMARGRHLFAVKFLEINGAAVLNLAISSEDGGIQKKIVDTTETKVGGRGPTFITYPLVSGYVNAEMKVIAPEMVSGGATQWSVTPALPAGITLDATRGEIRGKPASAYNGMHTITAVGTNGAASTKVQVVIAETPLPGFRAKYYKILDEEVCMYSSYAPSQVELKVVRVDDQINYPTSLPGVWEGLPTDFTSQYYAEWEGYLHFTEMGNWKLRLGCSQMCRLWTIEDTLQIDLWTSTGTNYCMSSFTTKEATLPISSIGYYYVKIRYAVNTGTKGIVFEWQAPTGNWEIVPADKIFHVAPSLLSYEYEQSHYFKDVEISENNPRLFQLTSCNNYRITPSLPQGLSMQSTTGIISGTPVNEQAETIYTITCTSNQGDVSTTILFDVFYSLPPSGLSLVQNGATVGNNLITLIPATQMSQVSVYGSCSGCSYTISPALPMGLSINGGNGLISGTPLEPKAETVYSVVARNSGGFFVMTMRMTVSGCKGADSGVAWNSEFVMVNIISGYGSISVKKNNAVVQCSTGDFDPSTGNAVMGTCTKTFTTYDVGKFVMFCMKSTADAKIEITCQDEGGCYTQTRRPDGHRWPTRYTYNAESFAPFVETYDYPIQLTPLTQVTLSVDETSVYPGGELSTVEIYPNGCYKGIEVRPALSYNYNIDLANPHIDGSINGFVKSVYTITAYGDAGNATALLTVHFKECGEDGKSATLKMVIYGSYWANEMGYKVYKGSAASGDLVFSFGPGTMTNYVKYTNTICTAVGDYEVVMTDSYGDGWTSGSYLNMYDSQDSLIQEFTIEGYKSEQHGFFTVVSTGGGSTAWKIMTNKKVDKDWTSVDFDDSAWASTTSEYEYGAWEQNTFYVRTVLEVEDAIKYPLVQFGIWFKDGMIVYLNGNEVYRRNMPSGNVNVKTLASGTFDGYYKRVGSAPGYLLKDGKNVLAVEIHKHSFTSGQIQFSGYANVLQGDCISRVDGGSITESSFFNQPTNSAKQAWDRNTGTEWIENGIPAWTIYSYNFDRMEWVNRLSIVSNSVSAERDPTSIKLSGSTDGVNWDELYTYVNNNMFADRGERKNFMMMDHMNSYSKYKFEMLATKEQKNKVAISVIDVMSCQLNYCVKDSGFPGVMSDETSVAPCPTDYIGEMYRKCSLAELKPSWGEIDMTECRSTIPPKNFVYVDVAYYLTGVSVEATRLLSSTLTTTFAAASEVGIANVEMWKVKDVTSEFSDVSADSETTNVVSAFYIRVTAPSEEASSTLKKVTNCLPAFQNALKEYHKDELPEGFDLQVYMKPTLQERKGLGGLSIALIIIMVILVLIVAAVVAFWIWVRMKSKKTKNGARQLRASGAGKVQAQHLSGSKDVRV